MKNYEKVLIAVGILLIVGIGVSFAYFSARTNSSGVGVSTTTTTVIKNDTAVTTEGVIEFNDLNIYPGHSNISKLKVTATGDQEVLYNLIWTGTNTLNTTLKYTIYKTTTDEAPSITCTKQEEGTLTKIYYETCTNNNFTNLGEAVASGEITTTASETKFKLIKNETLQATETGNTVYYYVVLEYPNLDESQNIDMNGTFTGTASIELLEQKELSGSELILANMPTVTTRDDFSVAMTADTTGTIYTAEDDDGTSYYFAGAATDNYVYFAGFYWRIIRINGDGTIRLIYDGTSVIANGTSSTDTQITTSAFNSSYNNNMYVGFMYTSGQVHGLGESSEIKGVLDTWYTSNLAGYTSYIDMNAGFCGDRTPYTSNEGTASGGGTGTTETYYGARIRLYKSNSASNAAPSFKCPESSTDLYTVSTSTKGNKALTNPIGLITADEVAYAGGVYGINSTARNKSYYLYTGQDYWTMSPYYVNISGLAFVFSVASSYLSNGGATNAYGVRPVINLKADTAFADGGKGTSSNPYVVLTS